MTVEQNGECPPNNDYEIGASRWNEVTRASVLCAG
jgi:hypothetical protein